MNARTTLFGGGGGGGGGVWEKGRKRAVETECKPNDSVDCSTP